MTRTKTTWAARRATEQKGSKRVKTLLRGLFPDGPVVKADDAEDRAGVDWWVTSGPAREGVDAKVREWAWEHNSDIALETVSVVGQSEGWTARESSDWILFCYLRGRQVWLLFPRAPLSRAYKKHINEWQGGGVYRQDSDGLWESQHVYVNTDRLLDAVKEETGGKPEVRASFSGGLPGWVSE